MWIPQIPESPLLAHELSVHHHGEVNVQDAVVVDGQAQNDPNEGELALVFKWCWVEPKQPCAFIICEHSCENLQFTTDYDRSFSNSPLKLKF